MNPESEKPKPVRQEGKSKLSLKDFFSLGEVGRYFFRSKDSNKLANINIRIMHGINRLAIAIFLAGVIYIVLKLYVF